MGDLRCPYCGAEETDRFDLDGRRFLVFRCLFTPRIDPKLSEAELAERLAAAHPKGDPSYFRGICDRLHFYVTKGPGARELLAPPEPGSDVVARA